MSRTSSTAVPTTTTPPSSSRRCPARSSTGSGPVTPAFRYCTSTPRPRPRLRPVAPGPEPGSPLEKRAIRQVGTTFALAGVFAFLFLVVYVGSGWFLPEWDWAREGTTWGTLFPPPVGPGPRGHDVEHAVHAAPRPVHGVVPAARGRRPGALHEEAPPARD